MGEHPDGMVLAAFAIALVANVQWARMAAIVVTLPSHRGHRSLDAVLPHGFNRAHSPERRGRLGCGDMEHLTQDGMKQLPVNPEGSRRAWAVSRKHFALRGP